MDFELRRANHADGFAKTRDGTNIRFLLHGDDGGRTRRAVLIHSLAMDATFWLPVIEKLDAAVLVCDCRGHGESDKPAGPYTVELFADDIADVMDDVGWDSALVAGASMGGCISLAFAAAYPARTLALGLIDTTAWYGPEAPKNWAERAGKAAQEGMGALVDSRPRAGLATPSVRSTRTSSRRASTFSCATTSRPMWRLARCSGVAICALRSRV